MHTNLCSHFLTVAFRAIYNHCITLYQEWLHGPHSEKEDSSAGTQNKRQIKVAVCPGYGGVFTIVQYLLI